MVHCDWNKNVMRVMIGMVALLSLFFVNHKAYALGSCAFTNPSTTLATVPSNTVYNSRSQGQTSAGMSCTLISISLLDSDTITAKVTKTTNNFNLRNTDTSGDMIPYAVFADQNYINQMTVGTTLNYKTLNLLSIVIGIGTKTIPLYVRTSVGSNVSAGTYTDTVTIDWTYDICTVLGVLGACTSPLTGSGTSEVTINLIVTKTCAINSIPTTVDLGANSFIAQFNPVTKTINVTCTKSEGYKTYFSNGSNYSSPWRRLMSLAGNYLQYHIYLPNTTTIWDSNNKQTGVGTGFSDNINFQVALNPAQAEQPAGVYTDTVVFTVEY